MEMAAKMSSASSNKKHIIKANRRSVLENAERTRNSAAKTSSNWFPASKVAAAV